MSLLYREVRGMLVKNETDNDLSQIRTIIKMHSKTNILVLELPD